MGITTFNEIKDIKNINDNEFFIIATPSNIRLTLIEELISRGVKNIIIEKPLALNITQANKIKILINKKNINIFVNYHRRNIKKLTLLNDELSNCIEINVFYSNGLINYASHAIDLTNFYFGRIKWVKHIHGTMNNNDLIDDSPSFLGEINDNIRVIYHGFKKLNYDLLDINFICQDKRVNLYTGGALITYEEPLEGVYYPSYKHLKVKKTYKKKSEGFKELYLNLFNFLNTGKKGNLCNFDDAYYAVNVCNAVLQSSKNNGKKIYI